MTRPGRSCSATPIIQVQVFNRMERALFRGGVASRRHARQCRRSCPRSCSPPTSCQRARGAAATPAASAPRTSRCRPLTCCAGRHRRPSSSARPARMAELRSTGGRSGAPAKIRLAGRRNRVFDSAGLVAGGAHVLRDRLRLMDAKLRIALIEAPTATTTRSGGRGAKGTNCPCTLNRPGSPPRPSLVRRGNRGGLGETGSCDPPASIRAGYCPPHVGRGSSKGGRKPV